jgi:hypothetical protein
VTCVRCVVLCVQCFACGDTGKDHVVGGVHKCQKPTCGKFYHQHCASQSRGTLIQKDQDEVGRRGAGHAAALQRALCIVHACVHGLRLCERPHLY